LVIRLRQTISMKMENDKFCANKSGSSVAHWRINQLNNCFQRFQQTSNKFQLTLNRFNNELKKRQKRHIALIDNQLSQEQIEELVSDPAKAQKFMQQTFQLGDAMLDRLAEIEERLEGMQKIFDSLQELQKMWDELNFLITDQQILLDNIENNVMQTKDYIAQAAVHLDDARKNQKKTRKLKMCLAVSCLVILIVILAVLGGTGVFNLGKA